MPIAISNNSDYGIETVSLQIHMHNIFQLRIFCLPQFIPFYIALNSKMQILLFKHSIAIELATFQLINACKLIKVYDNKFRIIYFGYSILLIMFISFAFYN